MENDDRNQEEPKMGVLENLVFVEGREDELGVCQLLSNPKIEGKEFLLLRTANKISSRESLRKVPLLSKVYTNHIPSTRLLILQFSSTKIKPAEIKRSEFKLNELTKSLWPDILMYFSLEEVVQFCEGSSSFYLKFIKT